MTTSEKNYSVNALEANLGFPKDSIFNVMLFETGGSLNPAQTSTASSATGLIQFLQATAITLGTTTHELALMSFDDQLYYVELYFKAYTSRLKVSSDYLDIYCAVLYPALIGKPDDAVMSLSGSASFRANHGLDFNNDGRITKGEIRTIFTKRVNQFRAKLNLSPGRFGGKLSKLIIPLLAVGAFLYLLK